MRYKGIIFDMDGVLVDSEPVILAAAMRALGEYGVPCVAEDFTPFIGAGENRYIGGVAEKYGVPYTLDMKARTYDIYDTIVSDYIKRYEGAVPCLRALKDGGTLIALASAADRRKVNATLAAAGIDQDLFKVVLTGEDVVNKKPSPDIYILAGQRLGLSPSECAVIEDAVNGVKAAKAAGMTAIGVTTSFPADVLKDVGADHLIAHIGELVAYLQHMA